MLNVLEAKIFQYECLEGHNVWQNNRIDRQHRNVVTIMVTKPEFLSNFGRQGWNVSYNGDSIGRNFEPWDGF